MVVANSAADTIAVYFGHSNGTFGSPIMYLTGSGSTPYMVAVGDLNNDGRLDIVVANFGTNNVGIFVGFENASFARQIELSIVPSRPISISLADFNNDKLLDIATANYGTHSVSIFYGHGNGNFSSPIPYSMGYDSLPLSLASGHFNNDSYLDLAVANYGTNTIAILFGNANGTFENQLTFSTSSGSHPHSIAIGYFNEDIFLDIAVANFGTNEIGVFLGDGNGTFTNQGRYSIDPSSPYCIGVGDLNQDNRLDLVVTNQGTNNIGVLLGNGDGTFIISKMYSTGSFSSISFVLGDFNKDRRLDIAVVSIDTGVIDLLIGSFEGFLNQTEYPTSSSPQFVAVGDFNDDNQLDIVVTIFYENVVNVFLGYGDGSFANQMTYSTGLVPVPVAVGDFNND
jgi:hypothetical protein